MEGRKPVDFLLATLFFGSMILVHHLSALIATVVLISFVLSALIRKTHVKTALSFLLLFALTSAFYSFFIVPYLLKSTGIGSTSALKFTEEPMIPLYELPRIFGYVATLMAIIGFSRFYFRHKRARVEHAFLLCWVSSLLLTFFFLDYGYRTAAVLLSGENFSAFTPSRFLTVMSYPLSILAAYALYDGFMCCRRGLGSKKRFATNPVLLATLLLCLVTAIIDTTRLLRRETVIPATLAFASWIKNNTPENAMIIYPEGMRGMHWMPYLTWRSTIYNPIPASENRGLLQSKISIFTKSGNLQAMRKWLEDNHQAGYVVKKHPGGGIRLEKL